MNILGTQGVGGKAGRLHVERSFPWIVMVCVCAGAFFAAGCGGGNKAITVQVVAANASPQCTGSGTALTCTLDEGQPLGFMATLANDTRNQGVTWTLTGTTCSGSGCGVLMNVTTSSVTYVAPTPLGAELTATLKANANANTGAVVTITLDIQPPPQFTTPAQVLPNGLNGVPYNQTITATGGVSPLFFSVVIGSLPAGLTLNQSSGVIVGVPTASGPANFTVQVKDSGTPLTVTQAFGFTINAAPKLSIQTTSLPSATEGRAYSAGVASQGGVPPITWSIAPNQNPETGLPPGFTIAPTTGVISGTTNSTGLFTFTVQAQDSTLPTNQTATAPLAINVSSVSPLVITTSALGNGTTAAPYSAALQATGGVLPYTWSLATGLLPSGLTLDPNTGAISGTPIVAGQAKFSVTVTDSATPTPNQATPEPLSITVTPGSSTADLTLLNGTYSFVFSGFDDEGDVTIAGAFTSGGNGVISAGLEDTNRFSGAVLGASVTGTYTIGADGRGTMQLVATDALGRTTTSNYLLVLESDGSGRLIQSDPNPSSVAGIGFTRGAGIFRKQTNTSLGAANFSGHYAFGFAGQDLGGNPAAMVGTVFADGVGTIQAGPGPGTSMVDFNDAGLFGSELNASGVFTASGSLNRVSVALTIPNPNNIQAQLTLDFAFYFVSDSDMFWVETDTTDALHPRLAGEMLRQSATTIFDKSALLGTSIASGSGVTTGPNPTVFVGLLTVPSLGNASLEFDQDAAGTITLGTSPVGQITGTYTVLPNGRADFTGLPGAPFASAYLTGPGQGFLISADTTATEGLLEQQVPGVAFTNLAGTPDFSNLAVNGGYTVSSQAATGPSVANIVGQVQANGMGAIGGTLDESGLTGEPGAFVGQTISIIYGVGSNGRGTLSPSGPPAGLPPQLAFYVVSPSSFRAVSITAGDSQPAVVFFDH